MSKPTVPPKPGFLSRQVATTRHFYHDHQARRRTGMHVVSAGFEQCTSDYQIRRRSFPWFGIELVASGCGRLELAGTTRDLVPGLVFTYGPGTGHAISAAADRPPGKWFIDLVGADVPGLLAHSGLAPGTSGLIDLASPARPLFDLIVDTGRRSRPADDAVLVALAQALVLTLAHPKPVGTQDAIHAQAAYERCRSWIEEHAEAGAGIREAAVALSLSTAYISRLFRRFDRVTPGVHARRVRLRLAADRLVASAQPIQEIAAAAGYADAFHFSRAFSRAFGLSPRAYRTCAHARAVPVVG